LNCRNRRLCVIRVTGSKSSPTVAQLRASFWQGVEAAMQGVRLPPSAQMLDYRIVTGSTEPTRLVIVYLGERDIETDAQALIADDVRARLAIPNAEMSCERVQSFFGPIVFRRNHASLPAGASHLLDQIGQMLKQHPALQAEIEAQAEGPEHERIAEERALTVSNYLKERGGIASERINVTTASDAARNIIIRLVKNFQPK
jgi:outer membrane protein OmpA-like peptidoglycan-associated protein